MTRISAKLPIQLYHQLQAAAKAQNKTVSKLIRAIVQKEMAQQKSFRQNRSSRCQERVWPR